MNQNVNDSIALEAPLPKLAALPKPSASAWTSLLPKPLAPEWASFPKRRVPPSWSRVDHFPKLAAAPLPEPAAAPLPKPAAAPLPKPAAAPLPKLAAAPLPEPAAAPLPKPAAAPLPKLAALPKEKPRIFRLSHKRRIADSLIQKSDRDLKSAIFWLDHVKKDLKDLEVKQSKIVRKIKSSYDHIEHLETTLSNRDEELFEQHKHHEIVSSKYDELTEKCKHLESSLSNRDEELTEKRKHLEIVSSERDELAEKLKRCKNMGMELTALCTVQESTSEN